MIEVFMPRLGVTMQKGAVTNWLVDEGDYVTKGDNLYELETEKSVLEIESTGSGYLKIVVPEGQIVPINTVIAVLTENNEDVDLAAYNASKIENPVENQPKIVENKENGQNSTPVRGGISPRARKLAKELGVALETVTGTGKGGLITEEDIRNAAAPSPSIKIKETIKLNNIKKAMADNLLNSWTTIPQFTQMVSVNMENVINAKKELNGITLNDIIIKAVGNAVKANTIVNSRLEDNQIVIFDEINVSVAVNSKNGLVVPVVKNVDQKSVYDISNEVKILAEKAANNQLVVDDFANGTITVSNLGSLGIEAGTPIINAPQSTIIFAGAIQNMPIVNSEGEIVVAPIMTISICYDHRFIDGVTGAQFTNDLKNAFQELTVNDLL
ncbi:dihydrolipoamide acetyltransferase family protein [Neobacillus drentensis]|uniref:dihydrolipoamide acetyltransferase family protein n=1 Tax=Neobacillus drentensis TaxID=220684 RepID=UPI00285ABBBA|nr:dihydrolipoamide acetyltransferase family protein [Neobacillus drentensis]MDR7238098.1 pyruvate dehydrogenase E2 component (dihydrolipoamide acetyltransferase) [Neobacillus drentensis]